MEAAKQILIVGGGLAGCFMAGESLLAGHAVTLLDEHQSNSPSRVAAGLYNTITGRVAAKTWMAEPFLKALNAFFEKPLFQSLKSHLHPMPIYRPYKTIGESNEWYLKASAAGYGDIVQHRIQPRNSAVIFNDLGGLDILPCGWVDTAGLVDGMKALLSQETHFQWLNEKLDYKGIHPKTLFVDQLGQRFDEIIFAEGPRIKENPWFGHLSFNPLKGQVLEISVPALPEDRVFVRKVYIVPRGGGKFVVGSTYEADFRDLNPTIEGVNTLKKYIGNIIRVPFDVLEARAGLRLSTHDRKPVCGRHPDHPGLVVFNGLGSKGVLQAPWTANHLRQWLDGKIPTLLKDMSVERFRG